MAFIFAIFGIFLSGISNPAGATELTRTTPPEMIGRVSAVYLLVQTIIGQTLGPLSVALAGEHLFAGKSSIAFGLTVVQAGCAVVAATSAVFVIRRIRNPSRSGLH